MTATILQQRLFELVTYHAATGSFTWRAPNSPRVRPGSPAGNLHHTGYRRLMLDGRRYGEHRLVWLAETGALPPHRIDHINGVRDDNRKANLRLATPKQNNENAPLRKDSSSGHRGVSWRARSQKWVAQIQHNKRKIHLGYFDTLEAAHCAYTQAATQIFTHYANR